MTHDSQPDDAAQADPTTADESADDSAAPTAGDRVLVVAFWAWAGLLLVATVAQLFEIEPVLDVLDVKRWFAR